MPRLPRIIGAVAVALAVYALAMLSLVRFVGSCVSVGYENPSRALGPHGSCRDVLRMLEPVLHALYT